MTDPRHYSRAPVHQPAPGWQERAACYGQDPHLFDATSWKAAAPALQLCASCTVQAECLAWVDPTSSGYDGVAGGQVWSNGKPATRRTPRPPTTTTTHDMQALLRERYPTPATMQRTADGRYRYTELHTERYPDLTP